MLRYFGIHFFKHLAVRNHQGRRLFQSLQRFCELCVTDTKSRCTSFQNIPDHLLLGQNQPSFRRCRINGNDQHNYISRF